MSWLFDNTRSYYQKFKSFKLNPLNKNMTRKLGTQSGTNRPVYVVCHHLTQNDDKITKNDVI